MATLWMAQFVVIAVVAMQQQATGNREHKVHNIVLYPNKQSWCTTRNISQVITEPGCRQVTIDNNVCVGACFSYSIPHTEPSDPGEVIGPYCDSCQPSEVSYVFVKVDCTENGNMKSPYLYKQVQMIRNCTCTACDEQSTHRTTAANVHGQGDGSQERPSGAGEQHHHHQPHHHAHHHHQPVLGTDERMAVPEHHRQHHGASTDGGTSEEAPSDSDMIQDDIPEILEVVHYNENDTEPIRHTPVHDLQSHHSDTTYLKQQQLNHYEHNSHTDNVKKLLHQKIVKLLHAIEQTNSPADREQLIEMIRLIKGTSDRNWDELVEGLQLENSILDFDRLRLELVEDEPLDVQPLEGGVVNANDGAATDSQEEAGRRNGAVPEEHSEYADHQRLMQHQYDAVRHRQTNSGTADTILPHVSSDGSAEPSTERVPEGNRVHHHAYHVVGERVDAHHHLVRGPHGSLVIRADADTQEIHRSHQNGHEIKEKINIQADELKPNHAGTVVSYDGHVPVVPDGTDETRTRDHHTHHHPRQHGHGQQAYGNHHVHGRAHEPHEGAEQGHHEHVAGEHHHGGHQHRSTHPAVAAATAAAAAVPSQPTPDDPEH